MNKYKKWIIFIVLGGWLFTTSFPAFATENGGRDHSCVNATNMVIDALLIRPLGIVATIFGSLVFVISLPFSSLGGNVEEAKQILVEEPRSYTFKRPIGEFPC